MKVCKAIYCKKAYLSNWNILSIEKLPLLPGHLDEERLPGFIGI